MLRTPSPSKKSGSGSSKSTSITKAGIILDIYRIHLDRNEPMPDDLWKLVSQLRRSRGTNTTPKSTFIQQCGPGVMKTRQEDMALHILADMVTYREKLHPNDTEGEALLQRGRSDQWYDRVPKPCDADETLQQALEEAMEAHGCPKKPKPNISFGYADDALDDLHRAKYQTLPPEYHLFSRPPWFPYQIVEWKSKERPPIEAEQQAQRDAAAANDVFYRFFKLAYPDREPSAAMTCIFSVCVHAQGFDFRVHWRRVADNGQISWEGDRVVGARWYMEKEVFEARGAIMNLLDWVRGERLAAIREALETIKAPKLPSAIALVLPHLAYSGLADWVPQWPAVSYFRSSSAHAARVPNPGARISSPSFPGTQEEEDCRQSARAR
ncbi:MAG: hypothetical protein LQ346_006179 [Caloplaca aetnensis]|nr:MAG: hypothetical protein LQ346_006179 [Caloplaca aetnensis]